MIYVNPDNFLGSPRVFTDERNREAWRLCKELVERTLAEARELTNFYIVCGVQGSGKTWWVKNNLPYFVEPAIVFDAALPLAEVRARVVSHARRYSCRFVSVWISCELDVALAQNSARPSDEIVPEEVVRLVFNEFEPPTLDEGFEEVLKVENQTGFR